MTKFQGFGSKYYVLFLCEIQVLLASSLNTMILRAYNTWHSLCTNAVSSHQGSHYFFTNFFKGYVGEFKGDFFAHS